MSSYPICVIAFYPVFMLPEYLHWPGDLVLNVGRVCTLDAE
jgi:hypothetical protein